MSRDASIGERRVRVAFNPSGRGTVEEIKEAGAALIDMIDYLRIPVPDINEANEANEAEYAEINRLAQEAMRDIESGTMWAVKAATQPFSLK